MTKILFSNRKEINWGHYGKEFQTLQNGKIRVRLRGIAAVQSGKENKERLNSHGIQT